MDDFSSLPPLNLSSKNRIGWNFCLSASSVFSILQKFPGKHPSKQGFLFFFVKVGRPSSFVCLRFSSLRLQILCSGGVPSVPSPAFAASTLSPAARAVGEPLQTFLLGQKLRARQSEDHLNKL